MIKFVDMFSGIGGFREGLTRAGGFECVGHCEIDKYANRSYNALFDTKGEWFIEDARKADPSAMPDFQLLCGGFPCQTFSIAGTRKGFGDPRGTLFFELARLAEARKPPYLLFENVPGLLSHDGGRTFATILNTLDRLGYGVEWQCLNSKDFGVPQSRNRVYIVGYLDERCRGKVFPFTETTGGSLIQTHGGHQGERVYSPEGLSCTLAANPGGLGGKTGLYEVGVPIKCATKTGYQMAQVGDSIDLSYATVNSRRGRVGKEIAHIEHEKALEQARTNFFSAVSHELKTPITIIKGQLEGMLLGIGPYKDHERYLTRSLEITNTLETMVQDILTISRLETAGADFKKDHLDCVQIIKAYLNETADLIAEKDLQIHLDILPSAFINGNKMLVEKVFSNLIGNAIKYSPQRADIWISVLMKHEQIVFSVENAGVHIPENSIPRLFDAFYRVEQSRNRKTGGSGLGLYIVQEILHQYGSECTVCNTQAGVKFSFII